MQLTITRVSKALGLLLVGCIIGFVAAYYVFRGEHAFGVLVDEVSALQYMEQGQPDRAHYMLRMSSEAKILDLSRYPPLIVDIFEPEATTKWMARYCEIRSKHPKVDYRDDGQMNARIDEVCTRTIGLATKQKTKNAEH